MSHALETGLSFEAFWNITPRELRLAARAYSRRTKREGLFVAWHVAALSRADRLPPLEELLAKPSADDLARQREEDARDMNEMIANHRASTNATVEVLKNG